MQLRRPIKGEDKRHKGKRFTSLQVWPEQGKGIGEPAQRGISKKKKKKYRRTFSRLGVVTNKWTPMR